MQFNQTSHKIDIKLSRINITFVKIDINLMRFNIKFHYMNNISFQIDISLIQIDIKRK